MRPDRPRRAHQLVGIVANDRAAAALHLDLAETVRRRVARVAARAHHRLELSLGRRVAGLGQLGHEVDLHVLARIVEGVAQLDAALALGVADRHRVALAEDRVVDLGVPGVHDLLLEIVEAMLHRAELVRQRQIVTAAGDRRDEAPALGLGLGAHLVVARLDLGQEPVPAFDRRRHQNEMSRSDVTPGYLAANLASTRLCISSNCLWLRTAVRLIR